MDFHFIDGDIAIGWKERRIPVPCFEFWKHFEIIYCQIYFSMIFSFFMFINIANFSTLTVSFPFRVCVYQPSVDIKTVLSQLMERLSNYAASSAEVSYSYAIFLILASKYSYWWFRIAGVTWIFASGSFCQAE